MLASPAAPSTIRVLRLSVGSALAAALTTALVEAALTLRRSHHGWNGEASDFFAALIALWGLAALLIALVETPIVSALVASGAIDHARGFVRRIFAEPPFDRSVAGWVMAAGVTAAAYAAWLALLALKIVAPAHRHLVAAVICSVAATASLPLFALLWFPLARLAAPVARLLPRHSRLPATISLGTVASLAGSLFGMSFVQNRLDWHDLPLGLALTAAIFFLAQASWARWLALRRGPLLLAGTPALALGVALTLVLPLFALHHPPDGALVLLADESILGRKLAQATQWLFDRDGDGYSSVLGGGDCDDHDSRIHPGARDWPNDGIDQNCLGGDAHARPPSPQPQASPGGYHFSDNVLFIFVDTLRADKLTAALMPNLEALARRGARFERAWAQAPSTSRSVPSLLTSRLPSAIEWGDSYQDFPALALGNRTLIEALQDAGYQTVGIASHFYFDTPGLTQGFDAFDNSGAMLSEQLPGDVSSPRILARVERVLPRLVADGRRFALWVHFPDPHAHYVPHPEVRRGRPEPSTAEEEYAEEATFVDDHLGRLFAALTRQHLDQNTMIVVFADHGEAFGRHRVAGERSFYHRQSLYEEVLRVPLVFAAPGLAPRVIDAPVALIDVAPTVLDVLGVPLPSTFRGRSLAGAMAGLPLAKSQIFAELVPSPAWPRPARALLDADGRYKLIYNLDPSRFELYDLLADPDELHDLAATQPRLMARVKGDLVDWLDGPP